MTLAPFELTPSEAVLVAQALEDSAQAVRRQARARQLTGPAHEGRRGALRSRAAYTEGLAARLRENVVRYEAAQRAAR